ncbi:MAG: succinate dehydrogenase [Alphaproteobacteria bacterium]
MTARLYLLQRASALILAPLVLIHLALIVFAVQGGLSGEEILGRTRGSAGWATFYGLFVLAVALHGGIGLRTVLLEWTGLRRPGANALALVAGLGLLFLGLRAVWAVVS